MKINKLFVSGGSHCIGGGFNWENVLNVYRNKGYKINSRFDITYPMLIANHFNYHVIFEGDFGGSVNRMIRKTYEYIFNNNSENTFFIFEIPPGWRDEFYSVELKRNINITIGNILSPDDESDVASGNDPNDIKRIHKNITDYFYNFVDYDIDRKKWMSQLVGLFSYLKLKNIPYLIIDNGDFQNFLKLNNISEHEYNFLWFNKGNAMHNWINDEKLTIKLETNGEVNDEHLGIKGHQLVANKIIEYVEENKTFFS